MGDGSMFDVLKGIPIGSRVLITTPQIQESAKDKPAAILVDILGQLPQAELQDPAEK
ncbi:hypothetical protein [Arcanobacterium hippocoleae]